MILLSMIVASRTKFLTIPCRTCVSSRETAPHKFAKKTLAARFGLSYRLRENDGRNSFSVVHEGDFMFDSAVLGKRCGEIRAQNRYTHAGTDS
jgi:hypothetical protein